jgi:UDPglucose 6-dehydrogenase
MRLTMVGTGYVGLVTGVCFANTGNHVTCLDIDEKKIAALRAGKCPIYEPGLEELLERNIKAGRLTFTTDAAAAYSDADMVFICVGTPSDDRGHTDLKYVLGAADDIAKAILRDGETKRRRDGVEGTSSVPLTVVVKSTVPVGTTLAVRDRIKSALAAAGSNATFHVANNPEFLKEGDAVNDFNKPDRVVVGVENEATGEQFRRLYDPFVRNGHPIYLMDILSSEMVKYASNNFLATKISFINEMANLCEAYGADIAKVREGMCADKRIGTQFLYPGLGYGGSCFPKDTLACIMMGEKAGVPIGLSRAVHETNQRQRERFFDKIQAHFKSSGGLAGKTIAFWGLAFKPRTDDVREAPALTLIRRALGFGATCRAFDPVATETARAELGTQPMLTLATDMYDAAKGADALVVCTDWDDFKSPDFDELRKLLKSPVIFDGRNLYRTGDLRRLGFHYISIGRQPIRPNA